MPYFHSVSPAVILNSRPSLPGYGDAFSVSHTVAPLSSNVFTSITPISSQNPLEILSAMSTDSGNDDDEDAFQPTNTDDCDADFEFVDSDEDEGMTMLSNQVEDILNRSFNLRS